MKSVNTLAHNFVSGSSRKRTAGLALLGLALGVLLLASCGGSSSNMSSPVSPASQGSVTVFAGDDPACGITSLSMTITGITLTPSSGGSPVSVFAASNPVTVDFASLMGTSMMLGMANVPAGTYSQATVALSNPQIGMYSFGTTGMGYGMMNSSLSTSSVPVTLSPPLQVSANGNVGMMLDLNLLKSVQTSNGTVTGTINPTFAGSGISTSGNSMMMKGLGVLSGIVQSVSTSSSNSDFTGSLTLGQWMMGRTFTVNVNSQTAFQNASGLSGLTPGMFVQVQAGVDGNGNLVASQASDQGQTDSQQSIGSFMGMLSSVTRDSAGNATQFQMGMDGEFPDMESMMGLFSQPQALLVSGAPFQIEDPAANFAGLTFDPTTMGPGQMVSIISQVTASGSGGMMGGSGSGSLAANSVMLQVQPLLGTFGQVLAAGGDGKTGGFTMAPCSGVFAGSSTSIPVLTSTQTTFNGMNGLNDIPAGGQLLVNGLLFWEPNMTNANDVQFTPPGWVFEATQVGKSQ